MSNATTGGMPPIRSGPSSQLATGKPENEQASEFDTRAQGLTQEAKDQAQEVKDKASEFADRARQQASGAMQSVQDKAKEMAEQQKHAGADQIQGVARAVHSAADELAGHMPEAAHYVREAASGIERFSSSMRNRSIGELVDSFNNFAKTQPTAFFGASVLTGFVLSRFLRSSAQSSGHPMQHGRHSGHASSGADHAAQPQPTGHGGASAQGGRRWDSASPSEPTPSYGSATGSHSGAQTHHRGSL